MTVGPGITPGLLTLSPEANGAASGTKRSRAMRVARNYRRWGVAPRPENVFAVRLFGGAAFLTHIFEPRIAVI